MLISVQKSKTFINTCYFSVNLVPALISTHAVDTFESSKIGNTKKKKKIMTTFTKMCNFRSTPLARLSSSGSADDLGPQRGRQPLSSSGDDAPLGNVSLTQEPVRKQRGFSTNDSGNTAKSSYQSYSEKPQRNKSAKSKKWLWMQ